MMTSRMIFHSHSPACIVLTLLLAVSTLAVAEESVDFTTQIRPLLSDKCFQCHGPNAEDREADLRLDVKESAFSEVSDGVAVTPGKPDESVVLLRIISKDEDLIMPPPDSGKTLTDEEKELIRSWIAQGAQWADHWAFVPPTRPDVPKVDNEEFVRNPIDAFVLRRLQQNGLKPSKRAERIKLLRRLHLDLTGLPPTVREIDQFLSNDSEEAYKNKVEELLRSPHYGEKWARHWLDAARYSDSDGFEKDKPRFAWNYRDWVVRALNKDLPYDQFLIDQLAGDLLPNRTQDQLIATGFLRNSMVNEEGGVDPEQFRMEAMFDRMDAIGKGILGLTIQCSQCHSHKYDPISQHEYYQMLAFINNSDEHTAVVFSQEEQLQRDGLAGRIEAIERQMKQDMPDWRSGMSAWEDSVRDHQSNWEILNIKNSSGSNSERYYTQSDGSILAQGYAPSRNTSKFAVEVPHKHMRAIQLEMLTDPNLPASGPGRGVYGLFALSEIKLTASSIADPQQRKTVKFIRATADYSNPHRHLTMRIHKSKDGTSGFTGPVSYAIDGDIKTAWGTDAGPVRRNQSRKAVFVAEEDFAYTEGTRLEFQFLQQHGGWNSNDNQTLNLGRFRVSVSEREDVTADPIPQAVRQIIQVPHNNRTESQQQTLFSYWRTTVDQWRDANAEIDSLWQLHPEGSMQLVMKERVQEPRQTHFLARGDFLSPKEKMTPGVPGVLNALPENSSTSRVDFAKWIADRNSPTVARAAVNRAWYAFFGTGIVATTEDLGSQGEAPSHPKLLDWLSVEFMDQGWSMKQLHRIIVMSGTYQQDSRTSEELLLKDPYNRLVAHGPRFRVDGELVRDITLKVSGLLNPQLGGPGVYPPSAEFLYQAPASYGAKHWPSHLAGDQKYRRALYTFRYRSVPYPVLKNFDTPNGDAACVRRDRSNTPLQALTTLNEPLFLECSQALALKTIQQGGSKDAQRIRFAFRTCLTREPTEEEFKRLESLLLTQRRRLQSGELNAATLLENESGKPAVKPPPGVVISPNSLAEWMIVSRVLLNLDETITKE